MATFAAGNYYMFGEHINWLETIDSTNNEAFRNLSTAPHGAVWAARFQTAGRGQKGNRWESAAGENSTFSILLRPQFLLPEHQFMISKISALAVCDLLCIYQLEATIKWPNDIYVEEKKIQGMLIEHFLSGAHLSASIVGIGINLNQRHFASNAPNPTSVLLQTGVRYDPESALNALLAFLEIRYNELLEGAWDEINRAYHHRLYRLDQWATYIRCATNTPFEAKIIGVDPCGCVVMERRSGQKERFAFKEIIYDNPFGHNPS